MTTMALVRGPRSGCIVRSSTLSVSGRQSAKTGRIPFEANALAADTNVNDGTITSSPGRASRRAAAISSAAEHEFVSNALPAPVAVSSSASHDLVNTPFPARCSDASTFITSPAASDTDVGLLNGIRYVISQLRLARACSDQKIV